MTEQHVGTFEIKSGSVYVTDPCYEPGTWCQGLVKNVLCGKWKASVIIENTSLGWGNRVHELNVVHEAYEDIEIFMDKQTFVVGVDAGVAGFFDSDKWVGRSSDEDEYSRLCEMTHDLEQAGCTDYGVISSSGFGDGAYDCFVGKNKEGKVVCMSIIFISDEDEWNGDNEEEEEDFEEE